MSKRRVKSGIRKDAGDVKLRSKDDSVSYRLKCVKTANGLSHFSMYGDVPKEKTVL